MTYRIFFYKIPALCRLTADRASRPQIDNVKYGGTFSLDDLRTCDAVSFTLSDGTVPFGMAKDGFSADVELSDPRRPNLLIRAGNKNLHIARVIAESARRSNVTVISLTDQENSGRVAKVLKNLEDNMCERYDRKIRKPHLLLVINDIEKLVLKNRKRLESVHSRGNYVDGKGKTVEVEHTGLTDLQDIINRGYMVGVSVAITSSGKRSGVPELDYALGLITNLNGGTGQLITDGEGSNNYNLYDGIEGRPFTAPATY